MTQTSGDGFCFSCRAPLSVETDEAPKRPRVNPWPKLVDETKMGTMRCQPLVRLVYFPTRSPFEAGEVPSSPTGRWTKENEIRLRTYGTAWHEYAHFAILDRLPAKEWARTRLAYAYDQMMMMVQLANQGTGRASLDLSWRLFQENNEVVEKIGQSIKFVEELLATSFMLVMSMAALKPGEPWEGYDRVFAKMMDDVLAAYESEFPQFAETFTRATPFIRRVLAYPEFLGFALPLLQPLKYVDGDLVAVDATANLGRILKLVGAVKDPSEIKQLLEPMRAEMDEGWRLAVYLQEENAGEPIITEESGREYRYGVYARELLRISGSGDFMRSSQEGPGTSPWSTDIGPLSYRVIYPTPKRGLSTLQAEVWSLGGRAVDPLLETALIEISFFESLRQQLISPTGMLECPNNTTGRRHCQCREEQRLLLHSVTRLALDGVFGQREFLPPSCFS